MGTNATFYNCAVCGLRVGRHSIWMSAAARPPAKKRVICESCGHQGWYFEQDGSLRQPAMREWKGTIEIVPGLRAEEERLSAELEQGALLYIWYAANAPIRAKLMRADGSGEPIRVDRAVRMASKMELKEPRKDQEPITVVVTGPDEQVRELHSQPPHGTGLEIYRMKADRRR